MRRLKSIRARVAVSFTLAFAAVVILASIGIYTNARQTADRDMRTLLRVTADSIRRQVPPSASRAELATLLQFRLDLQGTGLVLSVEDAHGRPLVNRMGISPWPNLRKRGWRTVSVPVGDNIVAVGYPWYRTERALRRQGLELIGFSFLVILAAAAGSWIMVGRTLSPIHTLSRQADAASVESLKVRLAAPSRDAEIVHLVETLNGLLRRLSTAAEARGRFYAAASHELRNPLQALLGHIEVALSKEREREGYRSALEEVRAQTMRLTLLVQDLLLLNQFQGGATRPPQDEVDLVDLITGTLDDMGREVCERRLAVREELPEEAIITAPPSHAHMITRNILENAVKYAASGGQVRVALRGPNGAGGPHGSGGPHGPGGANGDAQAWALIVSNECRLPEPLDMDRIFEPFYRPDASRQSSTGGNGLGLAICRAIADVNGWDICLTQDEAGVTATVLFKD